MRWGWYTHIWAIKRLLERGKVIESMKIMYAQAASAISLYNSERRGSLMPFLREWSVLKGSTKRRKMKMRMEMVWEVGNRCEGFSGQVYVDGGEMITFNVRKRRVTFGNILISIVMECFFFSRALELFRHSRPFNFPFILSNFFFFVPLFSLLSPRRLPLFSALHSLLAT